MAIKNKQPRYFVLLKNPEGWTRTKWTCKGDATCPIPAKGRTKAIEALRTAKDNYPGERYKLSEAF